MKFSMTKVLFVMVLVFSSVAALASPCGTTGMKVLRADDGSGYIFFGFRNGPDFYFTLPGREISFPDGFARRRQFYIDGILFESMVVKVSDFMKPQKGVTDLEILKKHQAYEFGALLQTPSPLKKFIELGPREKPAGNQQPGFTFYLWEAANPRDLGGARQYFLTTLSGGEVVMLSTIVANQSKEEAAMEAFEQYASSFQHVLKKERCPEMTDK